MRHILKIKHLQSHERPSLLIFNISCFEKVQRAESVQNKEINISMS